MLVTFWSCSPGAWWEWSQQQKRGRLLRSRPMSTLFGEVAFFLQPFCLSLKAPLFWKWLKICTSKVREVLHSCMPGFHHLPRPFLFMISEIGFEALNSSSLTVCAGCPLTTRQCDKRQLGLFVVNLLCCWSLHPIGNRSIFANPVYAGYSVTIVH